LGVERSYPRKTNEDPREVQCRSSVGKKKTFQLTQKKFIARILQEYKQKFDGKSMHT
ncbi:hypothetical protein MKX01_042329, partial [Papaver californicum]